GWSASLLISFSLRSEECFRAATLQARRPVYGFGRRVVDRPAKHHGGRTLIRPCGPPSPGEKESTSCTAEPRWAAQPITAPVACSELPQRALGQFDRLLPVGFRVRIGFHVDVHQVAAGKEGQLRHRRTPARLFADAGNILRV